MGNHFNFLVICSIIGVCSADNPLARMINGDATDIKDYPYQISMRLPSRRSNKPPVHFCGGAIIDETHILTAAHCVESLVASDAVESLTIHAGTSRSDMDGNVYKVASIMSHPEFSEDTFENDIAVVKLSQPIEFSDSQKSVELPSYDVENESVGTVTGWGDTTGNGGRSKISRNLQKITQTLIDSEKCRDIVDDEEGLANTQLCDYDKNGREVKGRTVYKGFCSGDSGGPLVADNQLVGLVCRTIIQDCASGLPDVYTNVYAYLNFIKENLKN